MRNAVIAVVAIVVLAMVGYVGWSYLSVRQAAVKWEGQVPEILSEKIEKEGDVANIELTSRIDAPVPDVFAAFHRPERTPELVEEIKQAKVIASDDNKKTVEFHLTTLGQLQVMTVDLSYAKDGKSVGIKTVEGVIDIDGVYELSPSPDGKKTLVTYRAKQKNKLPLPIPANVERSAIKEQFANLMKAIKKDLAGETKQGSLAPRRLRVAA
jgi:uncharacterized membrane protein